MHDYSPLIQYHEICYGNGILSVTEIAKNTWDADTYHHSPESCLSRLNALKTK